MPFFHLLYRFAGLMQVVAGLLLLFRRTATLGAIMYLPVVLTIFLATVSIEDFGLTRVIAGLMLLAAVYLVCWDYDRWKDVLPWGEAGADPHRHAPFQVVVVFLAAFATGFGALVSAHLSRLRGTSMLPSLIAAAVAVVLAGVALRLYFRRRRAEPRAEAVGA